MPDDLLRPALELAVLVARAGAAARPPEPAPRALRPFLAFARLPEAALAPVRRVLDADDAFRARVAGVATLEAVGEPSWLYLSRPEGWERTLAELAGVGAAAIVAREEARAEGLAVKRLAKVEAALRRAEGEVSELRAELVILREQLAAERHARHTFESDLGRARARASELEAELAAATEAEARMRTVEDEVARLRAECDRLTTELDDARVETAPVPPTPPVSPTPAADPAGPSPSLDAAAVARAVAAAGSAVRDLAGALAEAAEQLAPHLPDEGVAQPAPPAPAASGPTSGTSRRRHAASLPPGVFDDTVEAAAHLVRLEGVLVLVDGYNVTKLAHPDRSLAEQRRWLVDVACGLAARTGAELQLVFDGAAEAGTAPAELPRRAGVQVRYTPAGTEADDALLELVEATPVDRPVVVVSSDRRVQTGARRRGANVVASAQLLDAIRR